MRQPDASTRSGGAGVRQRGAAVLIALLIAALATLIVSGLFWNQFIVLRTIENQQLTAQSRLLLVGALDWARAILRDDRNLYDAGSEPWAQPLAETRLDQLGETSVLASQATIAGRITDAQARFNLRNLVALKDGEMKAEESEVKALRRLCALLGVPEAAADLIAATMRSGLAPPESEEDPGAIRSLPLVLPQDLYAVKGLDPQFAVRLMPYVIVLDASPTPINVNTATAEVIAARIDGVPLAFARTLVATRDRIGHFREVSDFQNNLSALRSGLDVSQVATKSSYFLIRGQVKLDRATTRMEALVHRRTAEQGSVRVLWQREL